MDVVKMAQVNFEDLSLYLYILYKYCRIQKYKIWISPNFIFYLKHVNEIEIIQKLQLSLYHTATKLVSDLTICIVICHIRDAFLTHYYKMT